ncbi:MAG: RNA polymerase sigma factor [Candidatus Woesearchaeota archaeon]|nr:RNA polymerase sigma factor [Candidatus Woesearchaeota archaeon]
MSDTTNGLYAKKDAELFMLACDMKATDRFVYDDCMGILYERLNHGLIRSLNYRIGNYALAEDLASETWLRSIKNAHQFDRTQQFRPWLYRIGHNLLIDESRKKSNSEEYIPADSLDLMKSPICTVEETVDKNADAARVHKLLEGLDSSTSKLLTLAYISEYSQAEIADMVGSHEDAIKLRLFRARKKALGYMELNSI